MKRAMAVARSGVKSKPGIVVTAAVVSTRPLAVSPAKMSAKKGIALPLPVQSSDGDATDVHLNSMTSSSTSSTSSSSSAIASTVSQLGAQSMLVAPSTTVAPSSPLGPPSLTLVPSSSTTPLLIASSTTPASSTLASGATPSNLSSSSVAPLSTSLSTTVVSACKAGGSKKKKKKLDKGQGRKKPQAKVRQTLNESQRMWAVLTNIQGSLTSKDFPMAVTRSLNVEADMRRLMGELRAHTTATVFDAPCGTCVLCDSKSNKSRLALRRRQLNCDVDVHRNGTHYVMTDPLHDWYGAIVAFAPGQGLNVQMQFDSIGGRQRKSKRTVPFRYVRERGARHNTYVKLAELVDAQAKVLAYRTVTAPRAAKIAKYNAFRDNLTAAAASASESPVTKYPFYISSGTDIGIPAATLAIQMRVHVIGICAATQPNKIMLTNKIIRTARALAAQDQGEALDAAGHVDDAEPDDDYRVSLYPKDAYLQGREFPITSFAALQVWTPTSHVQFKTMSNSVQLLQKAYAQSSTGSVAPASSASSSSTSSSVASKQSTARGPGMAGDDDSDNNTPIDVDEDGDGGDQKASGRGGGALGQTSKSTRGKKRGPTRNGAKSQKNSGVKRHRAAKNVDSATMVMVDDTDEDEEAIEAAVMRRMLTDVTVLEYGEDDAVRMQYEDSGVGNVLGWSACTAVAAATIAKNWPPTQPLTLNSSHVYRAYECGPGTPHAIVLPGSSRSYLLVQSNVDTIRQRLVRLDPRSSHAIAMHTSPPPSSPQPASIPAPPLVLPSSIPLVSVPSSVTPATSSPSTTSSTLSSLSPNLSLASPLSSAPISSSPLSSSLSSSLSPPSSSSSLLSSSSSSFSTSSSTPSPVSAPPSSVTPSLASSSSSSSSSSFGDPKGDGGESESKAPVQTAQRRVRAPLTVPPRPGSTTPWQLDAHGVGASLAQLLKLPRIRALQPHGRLRSAVPLQTVYALLRPTMPAQTVDVDALLQSMAGMDGGSEGGGSSGKYTRTQRVPIKLDSDSPVRRAMARFVAHHFLATLGLPRQASGSTYEFRAVTRVCIDSIEALYSVTAEMQYRAHLQRLRTAHSERGQTWPGAVERYTYHGTFPHVVQSMVDGGFKAEFNVANMYGYGNYTAVHASYSHDYARVATSGSNSSNSSTGSNRRHMFLCRTLVNGARQTGANDLRPGTGVVNSSNPNAIWLPAGGGLPPYPTIVGTDSVADPHIYVLAENDSLLPQFLITYHDV